MESQNPTSEESQRANLIHDLCDQGVQYQCGPHTIRFLLQVKSVNSDNTKESGLIEMFDHDNIVAHLKFSVSTEQGVTFIENKGYGKYEFDENEPDNSQELMKKYGGNKIIQKATSLLAEYGIYKRTELLSGLIDPKNRAAILSREHMKRTIGNGPFEHKWGTGDSSGEYQTKLRS